MQGSTVNSQGSQKGKIANSKNNNLTTDHDQDAQQKKETKRDPLQHGTGNNCVSEAPLKGGDSSDASGTPMDTDAVLVLKGNDDKTGSQSRKDFVRTASNQSNQSSGKDGSDESEGDGENESESEVIIIGADKSNF